MKGLKTLIAILSMFACVSAFGQGKALKKANNLYKLNNFAEAIPLYESALSKRENLSAKTKLAYCYRMTNKMGAAEKLYAQIVNEERATVITRFYYGEALMGTEKYDKAAEWFKKYLADRPDDEQAQLMLKACKKVKFIKPYFQNIRVKNFTQNSDNDDSAPVFFQDGIVFSSDRKQSGKLLKKKSGWTGRDFLMVYFSQRNVDGTFEPAKSFSGKINALNKNTGPVTFNREGTEIIYTQNSSVANQREMYPMQLYIAQSDDGQKWKNGEALPFCSANYNFMHPALSPDGQRLFFVTDKKGGEGRTDIFVCNRTARGWSRPKNLGPNVNTAASEGFPFVHADGKLYFSSKGHIGYGGFDIYFTEQQADGSWATPINVGKPINSAADDISIAITDDNQNGAFSSARKNGDDDIFLFKTTGGVVDATYSITLLEDEVPTKPAEPEPATEVATTTETSQPQVNANNSETASSVADNTVSTPSSTTEAPQPKINTTDKVNEVNTNATETASSVADNITSTPSTTLEAPQPKINTTDKVKEINTNATETASSVADNTTNAPSTTLEAPQHNINTANKVKEVNTNTTETASSLTDNATNAPSTTLEAPQHKINAADEVKEINTNATETASSLTDNTTNAPSTTLEAPQPKINTTDKVKEVNTNATETASSVADNSTNAPSTTLEAPQHNINTTDKVKEVNTNATETTSSVADNTISAPSTPMEAPQPKASTETAPSQPSSTNIPNADNGVRTEVAAPAVPSTVEKAMPIPAAEGLRINTAPDMITNSVPLESNNSQTRVADEAPLTISTYTDLEYALSEGRVSVGQTFALPRIKYPFNAFEHEVSAEIAVELDRLAEIMRQHPKIKVEIGGYTASFGENNVNKQLSRARAQSALDYLVDKGIDKGRMVARGYGESKPVNHCVDGVICTRNQHLENQRLEIMVLGY